MRGLSARHAATAGGRRDGPEHSRTGLPDAAVPAGAAAGDRAAGHVVDATNLTPEERRPYLEIGRAHGCEVEAIYFDVPLEICVERNARRERIVPEEAMEKMAVELVPPTVVEGFARVTVLTGGPAVDRNFTAAREPCCPSAPTRRLARSAIRQSGKAPC